MVNQFQRDAVIETITNYSKNNDDLILSVLI